jgi:hypothetical protein
VDAALVRAALLRAALFNAASLLALSVPLALDCSDPFGLRAAEHKVIFGNDQRLLEQERIGRSIANRPGDRLNLGEDLWIRSGYSGEPMPKGIAARIRFASGRARSAALSAVGTTGHDLCLRAHD